MKNLLILSLGLFLSAATYAACNNTPQVVKTDPNTLYACSMHPDIIGHAHEHCSRCGMELTVAQNPKTQHPALDSVPIPASENPLSAVYAAYFSLKNALVKDDGKSAQEAGKLLADEISAVAMDKLSPEQHAIWMKYEPLLLNDAERIKNKSDNKSQRKAFASLSKNMYEVLRVIKNDSPVYYQNCPMYDGGKGANWLSLDSKISNPYFGKEMLSCGKTVEKIQ